MFNVLIADDEYFIRQRIKKIIDWEALDMTCIGEAETGEETIRLLDQNDIDILLLDINMPSMSGLQVAEHVYTHQYKTKIIILTGFNRFDYAQTALKLKVEDYLVKPINKADLNKTLESCKIRILEQNKADLDLHNYQRYLQKNNLYKVIEGSMTFAALADNLPEISRYSCTAFVSIYLPTHHHAYLEQITHRLSTVFDGALSQDYDIISFQESESITMLQVLSAESIMRDNLIQLFRQVFDQLHLKTIPYYAGFSHILDIAANWPDTYQATFMALNMRYFKPVERIILADATTIPPTSSGSVSIRNQLTVYLNAKDIKAIQELLDNLFFNIQQAQSYDYLQIAITEIFITLKISYPHQFNLIETTIQDLILDNYTLTDIKESMLLYIQQCLETIVHDKPSNTVLVNKVIDYINKNYAASDLSVAEISAHFDFTPTYLGTTFKKITQHSLLQYLTNVRMDKAKDLLANTDYSITEISELVGYSDVFYFSKKFKAIHGCSPKEYAKRNRS